MFGGWGAAKDIQKLLPAQRERIDNLFLLEKSWPRSVWEERYFNHPLVGTLARRLIWVFSSEVGSVSAMWTDDGFVDAAGVVVEIPSDAAVSLWHPIGRPIGDVMAWRSCLQERQIQQPFKQAYREVYLLTDAERLTSVYSNRYAAHIVKQHQYHALCANRGWRNTLRLLVDDDYPPTSRWLEKWGIRAEFWVEGIGDDYGVDTTESGSFLYLATDQVRFYKLDSEQVRAHAGGGGYGYYHQSADEPIPVSEIPELVFSEIMRDIDLFVGVSSVAHDPNWSDGGPEGAHYDYWHRHSFGELSETAQTRYAVLEHLLPKLKIADCCSLQDKFLVVKGHLRTYKIHLGSGNILMEPNDQYLCIVVGQGKAGPGSKVFLPFEGDRMMAVILSKAFMLAADDKITDTTILAQLDLKK